MSKIRKAARGQECQVRIPGICNFNPETTVLAHRPGGPMGGKTPDYQGAFCCLSCHDIIDLRVKAPDHSRLSIDLYFYEGVFRTQEILREMGLIEVEE